MIDFKAPDLSTNQMVIYGCTAINIFLVFLFAGWYGFFIIFFDIILIGVKEGWISFGGSTKDFYNYNEVNENDNKDK